MKKYIQIAIAAVIIGGVVYSQVPSQFVWDANTEADLAGYRVYTCAGPVGSPPPPCDRTNAVLLADIPSGPNDTTNTRYNIPPATEGQAFVTAYDLTGNESGESVRVPFDLLAPVAPQGVRKE